MPCWERKCLRLLKMAIYFGPKSCGRACSELIMPKCPMHSMFFECTWRRSAPFTCFAAVLLPCLCSEYVSRRLLAFSAMLYASRVICACWLAFSLPYNVFSTISVLNFSACACAGPDVTRQYTTPARRAYSPPLSCPPSP